VQTAGDVATAVLQAQAKTFDLLISDLGLPDGSGIDLLNQLRASGHDYPAIAMTGFGQEEDIARTRAAGFTAHLVKPIDLEQMTRTIAEAAGPAQQPQPVTPRHGT
jgi:CheY-like chemotaxis protein